MSNEQTAPETKGVTVKQLSALDLGLEIDGMNCTRSIKFCSKFSKSSKESKTCPARFGITSHWSITTISASLVFTM